MNRRLVMLWSFLAVLAVPAEAKELVSPLEQVPLERDAAASPELDAAVQQYLDGHAATALEAVRRLVQEKSGQRSALAHELLGAAALAQQSIDEARRALEQAVRLDPNRPSAALRLGQLALTTGDLAGAEAVFRDAAKRWPDLSSSHRYLALTRLRQGEVDAALAEAERALELSQGADVEAGYVAASALHEMGRHAEAERQLVAVLRARTDFQEALLLQGIVKLDRGKVGSAQQILEVVAAQDPTSPWVRLGLAVIKRSRGDAQASQTELDALTAEYPAWALAQFQRGIAALARDQRQAADQAFTAAVQASPDPDLTQVRVGQALLLHGDPEGALAKAKEVLESRTASGPAANLLVQAAIALKKPELAEYELRAAFGLNPLNDAIAKQLGRLYLTWQRPAEAVLQFQLALQIDPKSPEAWKGLAEAHVALKQSAEAIEAAKGFGRLMGTGTDPSGYLFLASVQGRLVQWDAAVQTLEKGLAVHPNHPDIARALAGAYEEQGRVDDAIGLLTRAVAVPEHGVVWFDLAQLYHRRDRLPEAIDAYRQGLAFDPFEPIALNNLAYLLGQEESGREEAVQLAERAHRLAPQAPDVMDTLGWLYYQQGKLDQAEQFLQQAVRRAPKNPEFRYHLGLIYMEQDQFEDAKRELGEAITIGGFAELEEAQVLLSSLP